MKKGSVIQKSGFLFLLVVSFFLQPETALSYTDIPKDNLAYPVLIMAKDFTGSGFFYNKKGATYLITARHVLFDDEFIIHLPKEFEIPTNLKYKLNGREGGIRDEKGNIIRKNFILTLSGVISQSERDELIKAAPKSDHDAIRQLYTGSQKLKLKNNEIILLSYYQNQSDGKVVNELEVNLLNLYENGHVKYHPSQDVAFIRIGLRSEIKNKPENKFQTKFPDGIILKQGGDIGELTEENVKLLKDVIIGNQVFLFGYPTSITGINPWLDIKMPLLRKGIVAGKNEALKAIILDCPAFFGNSGGLVIEVEKKTLTETRYRAIGLIIQFAPYKTQWFQNSGYSVVVPMDFVDELITSQTE
jgi:hypothetical protein